MIRSKDLNKEIKLLELVAEKSSDETSLLKAIVKAITLELKVLRDMKTNQVLSLRKQGVELVKPNIRREDRDETAKDTKVA